MIKDMIHSSMNDESKPYWSGLQEGKLLIQYCDDCCQSIFYPRTLCPNCFSENIRWQEASGFGKIYSYTVVHQAFGPFRKETPFVVGIVELDEGVRMMTRFLGKREDIVIDKRVSVVFTEIEENVVLPYFQII